MDWLGASQIPFVIVFTKEDKLKKMQLENNLLAYKRRLLQNWEELPGLFVASSKSGLGKEEILNFIDETNHLFSS
jgi:GTP-binding protein